MESITTIRTTTPYLTSRHGEKKKKEKRGYYMSNMANHGAKWSVYAPLNGQAVALEQVPDEVFSEKVLGDGLGIIPCDGKVYSPVNGEISSVAETLHAYGFESDDGLEILVHVGLDTVALKGEGFKSYVNEGDKVCVGDLVAEVDLELLKKKGINPITPVLVCDGGDDKVMNTLSGSVTAGKDAVITLADETMVIAEPVSYDPPPVEEKRRLNVNFDFLQKLGKVLMTVIAVMPAAGFMLSLGKLFQMAGADLALLMTVGSTMENIGWAIITNLHILFAVAIGGSWAKERAGGSFAAVISFILINRITGAVFGVTEGMLADPNAVVNSFLGSEMVVENYFTSVLGADLMRLGEEIEKAERLGVRWLHLDNMDGHFAPNISFGPDFVRAIRKRTNLFLDVHLMLDYPMRYIETFARAGADMITIHLEARDDIVEMLKKIRSLGIKSGLSINPHTSPDAVRPYLPYCDMVLVMTVEPGFGGQRLRGYCLDKIPVLRRMMEEAGRQIHISVDGGIKVDNLEDAVNAGADVLVMGTGFFRAEEPEKLMNKIAELEAKGCGL